MLRALDLGNGVTQAVGDGATFVVDTKVDVGDTGKLFGNTYQVEYAGNSYIVGEGAEGRDYDVSKIRLDHKICGLLALAQLGAIDNELIIGCPLSSYINADFRKQYEAYFLGEHTIKVNGVLKHLNVRSVIVLPETIGVVALNEDYFYGKAVGVVDIGHGTTQACAYRDLQPVKSSIMVNNEGAEYIVHKAAQELISKTGKSYQPWIIPYLMDSPNEIVRNTIQSVFESHLNKIVSELMAQNWSADIPLVFTGGGSKLLSKQIAALPNACILSEDPQWDNVFGFYELRELV